MHPNPNRGDQLYLSLDAVEEGVNTVSVDIFDLFGKRVSARTIAVNDGFINTVLELNGDMANSMYMVHITAGEKIMFAENFNFLIRRINFDDSLYGENQPY